jgi:hypothetical protein
MFEIAPMPALQVLTLFTTPPLQWEADGAEYPVEEVACEQTDAESPTAPQVA